MPLPLPRHLRGRPSKEQVGAYGAGSAALALPPASLTVTAYSPDDTQTGWPLAAMAEAATDVGLPRVAYNADRYASARLTGEVLDPDGVPEGAELVAQYLTDGGAWANLAPDTAPVAVPIHETPAEQPVIGETVPIYAAASGDRRYRVIARGGDGVATPVIRNVELQFIDAGKRIVTPCNSAISLGADVYEDFCAYASMEALAAAYGYEVEEGNDWYSLTGSGYREFDGGAYNLYAEALGWPLLGWIDLVQTTANGGHKALVLDVPAGTTPVGSQTTRQISEWQIEGPTADVIPRAEVNARFNLEAFDDLAHPGSIIDLVYLRMFALGGDTAAMRLAVVYPTSGATEARLMAQRQTTPTGGSGPWEDLGPASDVLGAGDLQAKIVATVDEGVGVDFEVYLYGWGEGGVHAPIYTESVAGLYDRFQTARMLEAAAVTPAGEVPGAFKLTAYEFDLVCGSIIGGL